MNRTSRALWVNGALLVLVGAAALLALYGPGKYRERPPYGALLLDTETHPIDRLELARDGRVVTLERRPELGPREYRQHGEFERPGEIATVDSLGRALGSEAALVRDVTAANLPLARLGLDAPNLRWSVTQGGMLRTIELGHPAPTPAGARYARVTEGKELAQLLVLAPELSASLELEPEALLDTRLVPVLPSEMASVEVDIGPRRQLLHRDSETGHWYLDAEYPLRADRTRLEPWLLLLTTLRAERFLADDPTQRSVERRRLQIRLRATTEHQPRQLALRWFSVPGSSPHRVVVMSQAPRFLAQISEIAEEGLSRLPEHLQDSRLLFAKPDEIERVTLVHGARRLTLSRRSTALVFSGASEHEIALADGNQLLVQLWSLAGELGKNRCDGESYEYRDTTRLMIHGVGLGLADSTLETLLVRARSEDGTRLICRLDDGVTITLPPAVAEELETFLHAFESLEPASLAPLSSATISSDARHPLWSGDSKSGPSSPCTRPRPPVQAPSR